MYDCSIKYSSKISGKTLNFKANGTLSNVNGNVKLNFTLEDGQNFTFYILSDGGVRLISGGEAKYSILFKSKINYPFIISFGAFNIDASANTKVVKTSINSSKVEVYVNYLFVCGKDVDKRTIKLCAEIIWYDY